jgi:hypothetical protein
MKTISLKLLVRRFVVSTSFPPFLQIYRAFYALVIHIAVRLFRKYPAIKAVYLRRGCAKEEILPGVSDIDFSVIVDRMDDKAKKELVCNYQRFARVTILPDRGLGVYDHETLDEIYATTRECYRFMEGKATWKLLHGKDYLADLPSLPIEDMYAGIYNEMKVWWTIFAWQLLQARKYHEETVTRNSACYKTICEVLKFDLALNHGVLTFFRSDALEQAKQLLSEKEKGILDKLEFMARKRFRIKDKAILDETTDFLLNYLDRIHREFRTHPFACSLKSVTQKVDCPKNEGLWSEKEHAHIRLLIHHVKEKWSDTYRGAHLVSGYFLLDELVLMVEVDPQRLPTSQELTELYLLHCETQPQLSSRIHLYLLLRHSAFQIDAEYLNRGWQSILSPPSNPDLFELIGRPEFTLDGGSYQPVNSVVWTPIVEHFLRERKRAFYNRLKSPLIYELDTLDFVRTFWKAVQLVLINRSVRKDEILYPFTLSAVERALAVEGIPLPARLQFLSDAYIDELEGKKVDIKNYIPDAIAYLKEIDA